MPGIKINFLNTFFVSCDMITKRLILQDSSIQIKGRDKFRYLEVKIKNQIITPGVN